MLTVDFSSYYNWDLCGLRDELPPVTIRAIKLQLSGLGTTGGHLQVNALSKTCSGLVPVNEQDNPARTFSIDAGPICPDAQRPTDVILILDRSGSMDGASDPDDANAPLKIEVLNHSARAFYDVWNNPGQFLLD